MQKILSGLEITDLVPGDGVLAEPGKSVTIHYRGFLSRGEQFGSTYDTGEPITFRMGKREVIAGLEKGVIGMRVGGKRKLKVSPHLAYRDVGALGIPPNAVLIFEIELLEVHN